ncbi:hypothetical protein EDB83DRAFT_2526015 [Lactarius deliciosus]|nr:hypothetical protein EDB83DRAFT_2526015 [Lactarius deliciosus]
MPTSPRVAQQGQRGLRAPAFITPAPHIRTPYAQRPAVFPTDFSLPPQLLPPPLCPLLHSLDFVLAARTTFLILILSTFSVPLTRYLSPVTSPFDISPSTRCCRLRLFNFDFTFASLRLALLLSSPKDNLLAPMQLRPFDLAPVDSVFSFPSPPFRLLNSNFYANGPGIAT